MSKVEKKSGHLALLRFGKRNQSLLNFFNTHGERRLGQDTQARRHFTPKRQLVSRPNARRHVFKNEPFAQDHYSSVAPKSKYFATAKKLSRRTPDNCRRTIPGPPWLRRILRIQHLGQLLQTARVRRCIGNGRCVLGLVTSGMGSKAPRWIAVRNVSDSQIKARGYAQGTG